MAITTGYSNPIDLLRYILQCQNWGDNVIGEPSPNAKIRSGTGVSGSFDSTTLNAVRAINIRYQISDDANSSTKDLIDKICKQFNLVQYTDVDGYECVKYMFAETSDTPIIQFIIDDTVTIDAYNNPEQSKICVNPTIKYDYDYGVGEYTKQLTITNVQTGVYNAAYTSGFSGTEGQGYWNLCRSSLWPIIRHVEDMDSEWMENEFICDYAGAIFRLTNVIKLMQAATIDFTVPFVTGALVKAGDTISLLFPHMSTAGTAAYTAIVTSVSKSKNTNDVTISCMFIGENLPFELMDTPDENNFPLIDSYDSQPLQINNSYFEDGTPSPLTYIDPSARNCHITQINDDLTDLLSNMDPCQIGIATNISGKPFLYTDDNNAFHYFNTGIGTTGKILQYIDGPHGITGDSIITQKNGKIGIGLDAPLGNLHVHNPNSFASIVLSDINTGIDNGLELTTMSLTHKYDFFEIRDIPSVLYGTMPWLSKHTDRIDIGYSSHPELSPIYLNGTVTLNKVASASSSNILVLDGNSSICKTGLAGIGAEPAITAGNSAQYWRGDKTWQPLNTTAVAEGTNLYFTNTRVVSAITLNCPDLTAIELLTGTTGLLKKTAANTWTLDTSTYLTGNQTITLSGVVTGSGTTAITTSIADDALSIAKTNGLQLALDTKATKIYDAVIAASSVESPLYRLLFTCQGYPGQNYRHFDIKWIRNFYQLQQYADVDIHIENFYTSWTMWYTGLVSNNALYYYIDTSTNILYVYAKRSSGNGSGTDYFKINSATEPAAITWGTVVPEIDDPGNLTAMYRFTYNATSSSLSSASFNCNNVNMSGNLTITPSSTSGGITFAGTGASRLYSDSSTQALWCINPTTAKLFLGTSYSFDAQCSIQYTPGTVGAGAGVLYIGQSAKNSATFTHGITSFYTNGIERMRINAFGTLSLYYTDDTINTVTRSVMLLKNTTGTAEIGYGTRLDFGLEDSAGYNIATNAISSVWTDASATYRKARMDFYSANNNAQTIAMSIDHNGNVGIGTTSSSAKLDVNGVASFGTSAARIGIGSYAYSFANIYDILSTNNHGDYLLGVNVSILTDHTLSTINNHTTITGGAIVIGGNGYTNGTNSINFFSKAPGAATADTIINPSAADMIIKSAGIGIGTTDVKNWSTSFKALQVGRSCSIMARATETNTGEMYILSNCYFQGLWTATAGVSHNGYATIDRRSQEGYTWFGNTGLNAGDTISPTQLMILDYSGNLSVTGNINCNNTKTIYGACFTSWNNTQTCAITSAGTYVTLNAGFYAGPLNGVTHANGALTLGAAGTYKISFNLYVGSINGGSITIQLCDTASPEGTQLYIIEPLAAGSAATISAEILKTTVAGDSYYLKITNGTRADTLYVSMVNLHVERLSY